MEICENFGNNGILLCLFEGSGDVWIELFIPNLGVERRRDHEVGLMFVEVDA